MYRRREIVWQACSNELHGMRGQLLKFGFYFCVWLVLVSCVVSFDRLLGSWYLITVTANPDKVDEAIRACQVWCKPAF